jgi:CheY-like chemotaxis protein
LNILLIEDSELLREITAEFLEELGHRAIVVADAESALAKLGKESIDLVITDVSLPGMSGIAFARLVIRDWPDVPVVVASGFAEMTAEMLHKELSENVYVLTKPYSVTSLAKVIDEAVK